MEYAATKTPYSQDCTLVKGDHMKGPEDMSDAFLNLFDGPMLTKFCAAGQRCTARTHTSPLYCIASNSSV